MSENGTSAKKVTFRGDAKEDVDKICIKVQTTSDNAGGQPTWGFSLQQKTFSALNYAQDFGTTVKKSLKRATSTKWATLTKSRIVPCQILPCLCQDSQLRLDLPLVQTVIEFTNCIPKLMVQFFFYLRLYFGTDNVSRRLWQWIASHQKMDWNLGQLSGHTVNKIPEHTRPGHTATRYVQDWIRSDSESAEEGHFEVVYCRTCMTISGRSIRDHDWCVWIYEAGVYWWLYGLNFQSPYKLLNCLKAEVHATREYNWLVPLAGSLIKEML